jgi:hypothetical protein
VVELLSKLALKVELWRKAVSTRVRDVQSQSDANLQSAEGESAPDEFPVIEFFQFLSSVLAAIFAGCTISGVSASWSTGTIGVLFLAGLTMLLLSLIFGVYVSFLKYRSKALYTMGMILAIACLALNVAVIIFMGGI